MLFDLRGRGRRNTVKVIYVVLALLMGGGLILFGIGGNTSGGLVDAITGAPSGDTGETRFQKQEAAAERKLKANPKDEAANIALIRARVQLAGVKNRYDSTTNTYTAAGKAQLRRAVEAWNRYQALDPKPTNEQARVASVMVNAFASLNDLSGAAAAQEIVAETRNTAGAYSNLAVLAYQAGQTRKGDLAGKKALALTDKDLRASLKSQLDQAKSQGAAAAAQQSAPQSG
jgi:hypothetical protein